MKKAEIQQMLKRLGWVALVLFAAAIVISAMEHKDAALAQEVHIRIQPFEGGHVLITEKDIMLTIERSFGHQIVGLPLASVNVERLERVLEEDPFILDADVYVNATEEVFIEVVQREPVLRIMDNNGLNYYLDESGVRMPLSKHFTARVMVATGDIAPHVIDFLERDKHSLKDVFELAKLLRDDTFLKPMVEQIYMNKQGEMTLVPKIGDQKIRFGSIQSAEDKLERLHYFYREALPYEGWRKYRTISLEYAGQVVCEKA